MKLFGVDYILSVSAVGSLQEQYAPTDMVIPDQFFDRTRAQSRRIYVFRQRHRRTHHVSHPVCAELGRF
jgi:5'-methylthioadenosine phosphorylase